MIPASFFVPAFSQTVRQDGRYYAADLAPVNNSTITSDPSGMPLYPPGKIITLPARVTILDDPKEDRPHVALTPCGGDPPGILAYGSTQRTEAASNAVYYTLKPQRTGINHNGLRETTYVYPAILVQPSSEDLKDIIGFTKELSAIRARMVEALELGRGTCQARNAPTGSFRGRLMRVKSVHADQLGTPYVVVVTGHVYSIERNYQTVIPVYNADDIDLEALPAIAIAETGTWIQRLFGRQATRAAFPVPFIHAVWHRKHISSGTGQVVEQQEMRHLEAQIRAYFTLP